MVFSFSQSLRRLERSGSLWQSRYLIPSLTNPIRQYRHVFASLRVAIHVRVVDCHKRLAETEHFNKDVGLLN